MKLSVPLAVLLLLQPGIVFADTKAAEKTAAADVRIVANVGGKCGYVDAKGAFVIPPIYESASPFYADGLASVYGDDGKTNHFINKSGSKVFAPPEGVWISDWDRDDEFIQIDNGTKTGFMDRSGKIVLKLVWDEASGFAKQRLAPVKLKGKWGFIDRKGRTVVPIVFSSAEQFKDSKAKVVLEGFSYVLSEDGTLAPMAEEEVSTRDYTFPQDRAVGELYYVTDPNAAGLSTAHVKTTGDPNIVLTDSTGKQLGRQFTYITLDDDSGLFPAYTGNKYSENPTTERHGYINAKGEIALPFIYDTVRGFNGGESAIVSYKGKWGMIDRKGKWLIKPKFDRLGECQEPAVRMSR